MLIYSGGRETGPRCPAWVEVFFFGGGGGGNERKELKEKSIAEAIKSLFTRWALILQNLSKGVEFFCTPSFVKTGRGICKIFRIGSLRCSNHTLTLNTCYSQLVTQSKFRWYLLPISAIRGEISYTLVFVVCFRYRRCLGSDSCTFLR